MTTDNEGKDWFKQALANRNQPDKRLAERIFGKAIQPEGDSQKDKKNDD